MKKRVLLVLLAVCALVAAHLLDWWAVAHLAVPSLQESDLGRMLRILGFLPTWIVIAVAIVLCGDDSLPSRRRMLRGGLVLGSAVVGGIVAEITKLLIRRRRPDAHPSEYLFRPFGEETFHTGGLGMPSSHALVAFAALAMLGYLFPRARPLWWTLAAGCAFGRVAAGAHFLSDVVASAVLGSLVAALLWRAWGEGRRAAATSDGPR